MLFPGDGCALENGKRRKKGNEISLALPLPCPGYSLLPPCSELISHISQGQEEEKERSASVLYGSHGSSIFMTANNLNKFLISHLGNIWTGV